MTYDNFLEDRARILIAAKNETRIAVLQEAECSPVTFC